jgi:D-alanyl-D-alanine dipeptidase
MRRVFTLIILCLVSLKLFSCAKDPQKDMSSPMEMSPKYVDVSTKVPDAILDVRYATSNNFTKKVVYDSAKVYLVKEAANALKAVADDLRKKGYRLVIFDGYRPLAVQRIFWEIMPDPKYVADPAKGSRHNRGAAVDLSLADLQGNYLSMPTEFDHFGVEAHHDYLNLTEKQISNRSLLRETMEANGFQHLPTEWWHYDLIGWETYPIVGLDSSK